MAVNTLVESIQEALDQVVLVTKPSPFTKHWWSKELTELKHEQKRLSKLSYHYRGIQDHAVHAEFKAATNKLSNRIDKAKKEHWTEWLESATSQDMYTAYKYLNSKPSDYSSTQIPPLKTTNHQEQERLATENAAKAETLADTFFPPPPARTIIPDYAYPELLKVQGYFSREDIHKAIKKLKAYKAPSKDGIQNVII